MSGFNQGMSNTEGAETPFVSFTELLVGLFIIFTIIISALAVNVNQPECKVDNRGIPLQGVREISKIATFVESLQDDNLSARFDCNTKSVVIPSRLLFGLRQTTISSDSQRQAIRVISDALLEMLGCEQDELACLVTQRNLTVLIEGHADTSGQGVENWRLSSERAFSTHQEIKQNLFRSFPNTSPDPKWLGIAAYGETRPIEDIGDGEVLEANRRIEIRFVFDE